MSRTTLTPTAVAHVRYGSLNAIHARLLRTLIAGLLWAALLILSASPMFADDRRPVWLIYHRGNNIGEIAPAFDRSAGGYRVNAIEGDFRYCWGKWVLNHDGCYAGSTDAQQWLTELRSVADRNGPNAAMLWVDIKFWDGSEPVSALRQMIRNTLPPDMNVMYGSATWKTRTYLDSILRDLRPNEGVSMDFAAWELQPSGIVLRIEEFWRARNVKNVWFSDGLDPAACILFSDICSYAGANVRAASQRRDTTGVFKKTASWTYGAYSSALAALQPPDSDPSHLGADAVICQYTICGSLSDAITRSTNIRFAARHDSPWKHFDNLVHGDFDGDGKADRVLVTRDTGKWYVQLSSGRDPATIGIPLGWQWYGMTSSHDLILGDYDGDGRTDRAIVDRTAGRWYVLPSSGRTQDQIGIPFGWQWQGMTGDFDLALGDYDGDKRIDRAIVHRTLGKWYVLPSSGRTQDDFGIPFGWPWAGMNASHTLALGDYDGDGKTDRAIVDRAAGTWFVLPSSGRTQQEIGIPFGWQWQGMTSSHDLIPGDYDGDGKTDRAIVDRAAGTWYVLPSSGRTQDEIGIPFGWHWAGMNLSHSPVQADYDGDGRTDRAVVSSRQGWYVLPSSGQSPDTIQIPFGSTIK